MYNIYFKSADGSMQHLTANDTFTAQHMHDSLEAAGYEVLTERPH